MNAARRLLERAARHPERIAVEVAGEPGRGLSYGALAEDALALAARIVRRGARPGDPVALIAAGTPEFVTALLALGAAGLVCCPLDDTQPAERVHRAMDTAGARLAVVTSPGRAAHWAAELGPAAVVTDTVASASTGEEGPVQPGTAIPDGIRAQGPSAGLPHAAGAAESSVALPYPAGADEPAYVLFTSGSTGTPKGVQIAHGPFTRHCDVAREEYRLDESSVVLQFASPGFDVALEEIWPTLLTGGRVVLRGDQLWSLSDLLDVTRRHGITMWQLPTAVWTLLAAEAQAQPGLVPPPSLACVLTGGEAATPAAARRWLSSPLGAVRLLNAYGPTEGIVTSTLYEVPCDGTALPDTAALPIGRAIGGRRAFPVDDRLRPLPPGQTGELVVTGPCLADGYLGEADTSARAFTQLPDGTRVFRTGDLATEGADGRLVYHGRRDRQVKISGIRVEPGEVEAALVRCAPVTSAAVTVDGDGNRARLIAHVVLRTPPADPAAGAAALRAELLTRLPAPLVPTRIHFHERLPRTTNDKIDLPALAGTSRTGSAPTVRSQA
ncbi:amino acid adenylation domain-containing protein [Streptomyces sp. S.PB5]|uniref:amino acid adenylation domain-containing protein n=1 Tax=Streptomyces sp. S.PB5 TaxID=3020844 RepID=UPI0025AF8181|nr:amino acid adenylation domain-containing protein [Streptomyces sp. S.PB5]MDN3025979.1 amino acid adenylation domain-containing protein [Streptomyces sp. S.PB5]